MHYSHCYRTDQLHYITLLYGTVLQHLWLARTEQFDSNRCRPTDRPVRRLVGDWFVACDLTVAGCAPRVTAAAAVTGRAVVAWPAPSRWERSVDWRTRAEPSASPAFDLNSDGEQELRDRMGGGRVHQIGSA